MLHISMCQGKDVHVEMLITASLFSIGLYNYTEQLSINLSFNDP